MKSKLPLFNNLPAVPLELLGQRARRFARLQLFEFSIMQGGHLPRLIARPGALPLIICDASAFRRENPEFARDLLARHEVWVAPAVVPELLRLRDDPTSAVLNSIIFDHGALNDRIKVIDLPADLAPAAAQYVGLLRYRKRLLTLETKRFLSSNGRQPNEAERSQIAASLRTLGPRVSQLATKFGPAGEDEGADEWTVVMALILALLHDTDATVLTADLDLHEQLYKFTSLLRDHFAANLLAEDYLAHPERYGTRVYLSEHADLDPYLNNKGESFVVTRPENLDYLFPRSEHPTRAVSVALVRPPGESFTWVASKQMLSFLRKRGQTGRNTTALGPNLDAHIAAVRLQRAGTLPNAHYAFFLDEHRHGVSETIGSKAVGTTVGRVDIMRAAVDSEHRDPRHANAQLYENAIALHRRQHTDLAVQLGRELLRRSNNPENSISALGLSQTLLALASITQDKDPERALASYDRLILEFEEAKTPALVEIVARARINKGQLLFNIGRTAEALRECESVEKQHVGSVNPILARHAMLAGFNKIQCYLATKDLALAAEASIVLLIRIGIPPQDFDLYNMAVFCACKYLHDLGHHDHVLERATEILGVSDCTHHVENRVTLLTTLGEVMGMTRMRPLWLSRRLYNLLRDAVATTKIPLARYEEIARGCFVRGTMHVSMAALLSAPDKAVPRVGASQRPAREGARIDLFTAHVWAARSDIAARATWFGRVRDRYQNHLDAEVREVGLEAGRLARLCYDDMAIGIAGCRKTKRHPQELQVTGLAPDGRIIKLTAPPAER
jgi:tetratricopeptide (TPR) repeat protein